MRKLTENSQESEKAIERYLATQCAARGWLCLKYAATIGMASGYPDRIVCTGAGHTAWVELKSKGRKPTALQLARHQQLRAFGYRVFVADSRAAVDELINALATSAR
jgi:hypothetical protein